MMPALLFGRSRGVVMGLLVLAAAAPGAQAQSHPRWQVEASLDQTGASSMHSAVADGPNATYELRQREAVRYSVGASRLARLAPRTSLRLGLSLSNKGFSERSSISSPTGTRTTERHVELLYLGAPLTLGYNLVSARRGIVPVAEAGVVAEVLLREDESLFDYDLRKTGLSYLVNAGGQVHDGRRPRAGAGARAAHRRAPVFARDSQRAGVPPRDRGVQAGLPVLNGARRGPSRGGHGG
jgi:hypothetical protein